MFKRGKVWWTKINYNGRVIQKILETPSKSLAKDIEAKIRIELKEGKYFKKEKGKYITVKSLIDRYLEDHSKPNKKCKTYKNDISLSKTILRYLGEMILTEVTPRHISAYIKQRRKAGRSDVTINHELVLLKHAYNLAIKEWELISETPFVKIKLPKADVKRVRYLSCDEEDRLLEALPD